MAGVFLGVKEVMAKLSNLEPLNVFKYFEEISEIPSGEGDTSAVGDYIENYAKSHSFRYEREDNGNIIIYVPATNGYENAEPIMLQGHIGTAGMVLSYRFDAAKNQPAEVNIIDDYIGIPSVFSDISS